MKRKHESAHHETETKAQQPLKISDLQRDVTCHIFTFLGLEDRAQIRLVCKSFHLWSSLQQSWPSILTWEGEDEVLVTLATSLRGKRFKKLTSKKAGLPWPLVFCDIKTSDLAIITHPTSRRMGLDLLSSMTYRSEIKKLYLRVYGRAETSEYDHPFVQMSSLTDLDMAVCCPSGEFCLSLCCLCVLQEMRKEERERERDSHTHTHTYYNAVCLRS